MITQSRLDRSACILIYLWTTTSTLLLSVSSRFIVEANELEEDVKEEKKCTIFIAPSSLLGNSGFGVYTTRDIAEGDAILSGPEGTPDGPALTVIDPSSGYWEESEEEVQQWNRVFGHYWWGRGVPEHAMYEAEQVMDFQITFGALPNHHCILGSLEMHFPENDAYDDSLTNRFQDPGAGAYSYHPGRIFFATYDLPAGSEIFLSYGYCSRKDKENPEESPLWYPEWTDYIPMEEDFKIAAMATRSLWNSHLKQTSSGLPEDIPDNVILQLDSEPIMELFKGHLTPHARALLPNTTTQLKHIMTKVTANSHTEQLDTSPMHDALTRYLARQFGTTPRTPEWVEEHGMCIEHMIPGPSTLPHAGRGGFAQHSIRSGEIVVPVPLLHITNKHVLHLTDSEGEMTEWQQVLTNYCFSHRESTLALCPTSNVILINHCSTRTKQCGPDGPNAKIQWASPDWDPRTQTWLNATVDDMDLQVDRLLAMEVIATRDIAPGDEVFLDYGLEWEEAWQMHVKNWAPDEAEAEEYHFSISEANRDLTAPLMHLVSGSFREEANHPYIFTACLYWPTDQDEQDIYHDTSELNFEEMTDQELWELYANDGHHYQGDYSNPGNHQMNWWPCSVLLQDNDESDEEVTYLVRITQHPSVHPLMPWAENDLPRFLYYYPRSSIRYFAKPYNSDQFLYGAFRHFIPISDEMFREQWHNLPSSEE